jgi:anti-anti-sigma factor
MMAETTFSLDSQTVDATLMVSVVGVLDLRTEAEVVDAVAEQLDGPVLTGLVVNLVGVEFIDSSGLRALLRCREMAESANVPMKLIPNKQVSQLLVMAGIEEWFDYA